MAKRVPPGTPRFSPWDTMFEDLDLHASGMCRLNTVIPEEVALAVRELSTDRQLTLREAYNLVLEDWLRGHGYLELKATSASMRAGW